MIQFNLLPDVKLQYIKAERSKRLFLSIAVVVSLAAIGLLVLLLSVDVLQKKHLSDLSNDIKQESSTLQSKPDINTILTVQNQLESLTTLHSAKPAANRMFGYLNSLTPATISITSMDVDYAGKTMTITGTADALSSVNKYVDTIKLTTYSADSSPTQTAAFSDVVLSSFARSTSKDTTQATTYTITLAFDGNIFDNTKNITLNVPSVTTRAQIQNPSDLFKDAPTTQGSH